MKTAKLPRTHFAFLLALMTWLFAAPVHAQISVLSKLSDDRTALPGSVYEGEILVRNDTDTPQQVKIYQTDYHFDADGTNRFDAAGSSSRSNAGWVRFSPATLLLPPQEVLPVNYVVRVPEKQDDQVPCGSYWSVLFIEAVGASSPESLLPDAETRVSFATQMQMRYGVQLATHITGSCTPEVRFERVELIQADDGQRLLQVDVRNTGSSMMRPDFWVELYSGAESTPIRLSGEAYRLYPGTAICQNLPVDDVPEGSYEALLVVDTGAEDIFGAQVALDL